MKSILALVLLLVSLQFAIASLKQKSKKLVRPKTQRRVRMVRPSINLMRRYRAQRMFRSLFRKRNLKRIQKIMKRKIARSMIKKKHIVKLHPVRTQRVKVCNWVKANITSTNHTTSHHHTSSSSSHHHSTSSSSSHTNITQHHIKQVIKHTVHTVLKRGQIRVRKIRVCNWYKKKRQLKYKVCNWYKRKLRKMKICNYYKRVKICNWVKAVPVYKQFNICNWVRKPSNFHFCTCFRVKLKKYYNHRQMRALQRRFNARLHQVMNNFFRKLRR